MGRPLTISRRSLNGASVPAWDDEVNSHSPSFWLRMNDSGSAGADELVNSGTAAATGVTIGSNPLPENPNVSGSVFFDATGDELNAPTNPNLSNSWTLVFWAKPTATTATIGTANYDPTTATGARWAWYPNNAGTDAGLGVVLGTNWIGLVEHGNSWARRYLGADLDLSGAEWAMFTVVVDTPHAVQASDYTVYVNDEVAGEGNRGRTNIYNPHHMKYISWGTNFSGEMSEAVLFPSALSRDEVRRLYWSARSRVQPTPSGPWLPSKAFSGFDFRLSADSLDVPDSQKMDSDWEPVFDTLNTTVVKDTLDYPSFKASGINGLPSVEFVRDVNAGSHERGWYYNAPSNISTGVADWEVMMVMEGISSPSTKSYIPLRLRATNGTYVYAVMPYLINPSQVLLAANDDYKAQDSSSTVMTKAILNLWHESGLIRVRWYRATLTNDAIDYSFNPEAFDSIFLFMYSSASVAGEVDRWQVADLFFWGSVASSSQRAHRVSELRNRYGIN